MADQATITAIPADPDEEWESTSSSDDDYDEDENICPPQSLLFSHENPAPRSPLSHAPRSRLLFHSRDWHTQVYMLDDGNVLKERSSYPKLSDGFFAAEDMNQALRHWHRVLPEKLEDILGAHHPYLSRFAVPVAPRQLKILRGSGNSDHLPDQLTDPFPEMEGRVIMERMRPIKAPVIRIVIDQIIDPSLQQKALGAPENYNLHPKAWLGFEQTPAVSGMLRDYPNLSTRPAYLDQLLTYIGRPGVLELARQMGTALAVIHYDLNKDARDVKFRIGYDAFDDKAVLWVSGLGHMDALRVNEAGDGFVGDPAGYV